MDCVDCAGQAGARIVENSEDDGFPCSNRAKEVSGAVHGNVGFLDIVLLTNKSYRDGGWSGGGKLCEFVDFGFVVEKSDVA